MNFKFKGKISSSKSLVNRYLILKKENSHLNLKWSSEAEDVLNLKKALDSNDEELYVGQGGTTLRFLAIYLSSQKGSWVLKGEEELFKRPQEDLINALKDLGSEVNLDKDRLFIKSSGWQTRDISVSCAKTSQVVTAVILTAVSINQDFKLKINDENKASKYLKTTIDFLKEFNSRVTYQDGEISVFKVKELSTEIKEIEADWSSAAFLFSVGALFGSAEILNLNNLSLQPDAKVKDLFAEVGILIQDNKVDKINKLNSFKFNIKDSPDLFPVLSVLAAFTDGETQICGAPQLRFKETDRIKEIYSLLSQCGYDLEEKEDGLKVRGCGLNFINDHKAFDFDCSHDHRLVMAAFILKMKGYKINIIGINSINKSFPEFFEIFKGWL